MIKIPSQMVFMVSPIWIFFVSIFIFYLISYQSISFLGALVIMGFLFFLTFWQDFLSFRRSGELIGLKSKKRIFVVSMILVLGFTELIWAISFLPFSFFVLSGIVAIIFGVVLDIYKEYFRKSASGIADIRRILIRDIITGIVLIVILIFISPWLPPKVS